MKHWNCSKNSYRKNYVHFYEVCIHTYFNSLCSTENHESASDVEDVAFLLLFSRLQQMKEQCSVTMLAGAGCNWVCLMHVPHFINTTWSITGVWTIQKGSSRKKEENAERGCDINIKWPELCRNCRCTMPYHEQGHVFGLPGEWERRVYQLCLIGKAWQSSFREGPI